MYPNIKKRNKSLYRFSNTQMKNIIGNTALTNFYPNNEYDNFLSTVSNITKQISNMSLSVFSKPNNNNFITSLKKNNILESTKNNLKDIFYILPNKKNDYYENKEENKKKTFFNNSSKNLKKERITINSITSFFISATNTKGNKNLKESELKQENEELKENIKFLLSQVKKYQKSGITIDEKKNFYNNENEQINKLKNIIDNKNKEIEEIKKNYQKEMKSILEKISNLENEYQNLKNNYNELKNKNNNNINNIKRKNKKDSSYLEILKLNNSEILENNYNNLKINCDINNRQRFIRNKIFNNYNENAKNSEDNDKNIEDNFLVHNKIDKRFTFHRAYHTSDFNKEYIFNNNNIYHKYNKNRHFNNFKDLPRPKYFKFNDNKYFVLNNTFDERELKKEQLILNEKKPKTAKANDISFLYKKSPIKTEIINNLNIKNCDPKNSNYKPLIAKSAPHYYLEANPKSKYQNFREFYKNNLEKEEHKFPKLIRKLSSTLYRKKNNKNFSFQINSKLYNKSYNDLNDCQKYYTKEEEINKNVINPPSSFSFSSVRLSKLDNQNNFKGFIPKPEINLSPIDLYYFPKNIKCSIIKNKIDNNIVYKFNIDNMKYTSIKYLLENDSSFNLSYSTTINHFYDILLSISNGFLIITGEKTDCFYYYNKNTNIIYSLCNLNYSHNKGALLKINNEQIMCLSGINSFNVEMYYIKDNIWLNLPKMNCSHSESSYMVYNNNIIFSFFGYDYDNNKYINHIEFLVLKNFYSEEIWKKITISSISNNYNLNLRNHSIFYRINKENNDSKDIFIVGGYNDSGRNNGLIQVFFENEDNNYEFKINFKKYEENRVKLKGNNNISLNKYNSMNNIFLFSNEFNQFFDEECNLFYSYNYDTNFNIHIIDNFTLKHTIYRNKLQK